VSSTKRTKERKLSIDYYVTPVDEIRLFLEAFMKLESLPDGVLDPCAGGDKEHPMSYPAALAYFGIPSEEIVTIDIRKDSRATIKADYLTWKRPEDWDRPRMIITNPPFSVALDVIQKALYDVAQNGFVVMLLRLNFFGSRRRRAFFHEYMPKYVFVHPKRMSFTPDGQTDSIEYMHAVWEKEKYPSHSKLFVL